MRKGPAFVAIHVPARRVGSAALAAVLLAALAAGLGLLPAVLPAAVPGVLGNVAPGGAAPAAAGPPAEAAPLRADTPVYRVPVDEQLVAFAVNLDWGGELLPDMLAVLDRYGARVTFFPTARFAELEPELVRGLVRAGHELGNHGWRHDHPKALDDAALRDHIVLARQRLKELTGVETKLYAPPYGEVDARIARIAAGTGHWTVMWTIDTVDWRRPAPEVIVRRVVPHVQPGAIVLMHPTEPTLAALPSILEELTARGWRVVPVGALLERRSQRTARRRTSQRCGSSCPRRQKATPPRPYSAASSSL